MLCVWPFTYFFFSRSRDLRYLHSFPTRRSSDLFNCRGFGPLLEDKLCLIFKLAPSVCRMTFPILASLLVRLNIRHRSEERFSRNAETDLVCRPLLEKKNARRSCLCL